MFQSAPDTPSSGLKSTSRRVFFGDESPQQPKAASPAPFTPMNGHSKPRVGRGSGDRGSTELQKEIDEERRM